MQDKEVTQAEDLNNKEIDKILIQGFIERASTLSIIYALTFGLYSFTSIEFIKKFDPSITLLANTWPRLLFNTLPFIVLYFILKKTKLSLQSKGYIWAIGMPTIFMVACFIYIWPLIWSGSTELYLYVHAPNTFIIVTALIIAAPTLRFTITQTVAFVALALIPLCTILIHANRVDLLKWAMSDMVIAIATAVYAAHVIHRLRRKVLISDLQKQKNATSFLGNTVANAIFNDKSDLLKNRQVEAIVVKIDIRGSTPFANQNDEELVVNFMSEYSNIVSHCVGKSGGYWNKSIGDGHLITYGAMDFDNDLSDIPGLEGENESALNRIKRKHFENSLQSVTSIAFEFERLKEKYDVQDSMSLGMAIDTGKLLVRLQGDVNYKTELEMGGRVLYRCTRLEEYTKALQKKFSTKESILILSPELAEYADERMFKKWSIEDANMPVRDYPQLKTLYFHIFKDLGERRSSVIRLRAS